MKLNPLKRLGEIMLRSKTCEVLKVNSRLFSNIESATERMPLKSSPEMMNKTVFAPSQAAAKLTQDIHQILHSVDLNTTLDQMSKYYFDGQGKAVRPALTLIMASACNSHLKVSNPEVEKLQKQIAIICEMIHTSSLLHDDVIDHAETRRGKMSVNRKWSQSSSIYAGVYILASSMRVLAGTNNPDVIRSISQILYDLVNGEFQQMSSRDNKDDRFQLYLDKTFNKTASLMANSCKSVAILAAAQNTETKSADIVELSYKYGQNIGIAFQLVDDWLDFVSSADLLGKPSAADLSLGLATAPVLFASEQFPQLNNLILRRFSEPGDVEKAFKLVCDSEGLQQTKMLAVKYKNMAMDNIKHFKDSEDKDKLSFIAEKVIDRMN